MSSCWTSWAKDTFEVGLLQSVAKSYDRIVSDDAALGDHHDVLADFSTNSRTCEM